ncbi:hypothetical protein BDN70DRAFT_903612 [Pholiota conissans]|uniref:General stress protein FMN-binding split barrel domain-containing protein n=1 Tax=Pholiota conissans TaxID=109636 RepID=A0A9P5ZCK5_9AGAR|nr:hypothetical protein BDN70DRAFT_903612 [Pholiota conissans]
MSTINSLDPYSVQAQNDKASLQERIQGLKEIIRSTQNAMLTTRSADGELHSRAMTPVAPDSETQLTLLFIANNVSHKFEEIANDSNVNVSFLNPTTTNWASFAGRAKIIEDRDEIAKHWSAGMSAWFGDLRDGVHKGNAADPRVALIQVIPEEIRYWQVNKSKLGRALEIGVGSITGKTAHPGELNTITRAEIELTQVLHTKN